jgi:hypothetical protein
MTTVKKLRELCKQKGITGYSNKKKSELEKILADFDSGKTKKKVTVVELRKKCREKKKKNCSKLKKKELEQVLQKTSPEKQKKHVPKDVEILDYSIGKPVSIKDAKMHFVKKTITFKEGQLTKQGKYLDFITLQQYDPSDLVQLRESDEIYSKETFNEIIHRNKTTWCGKESVGFKSPNNNTTIFGNLVLFNYNDEFLPQKPGTLKIKVTPNFFELSYVNFRFVNGQSVLFYIPNNKDGLLLLCIMKDAFKKGNLFGFSKSGRVRHGRIHKKTSKTGIRGFPDKTYIERAIGELNLLGSSPYIYSFSHDKNFTVDGDPYPAEKRWKIIVSK